MKKIKNPFADSRPEDYNCFGCSPGNIHGLQLHFWEDNGEVLASWIPDSRFEGWKGIIHGGIQATLIDEVASWYVFVRLGTSGVTSDMSIRYKKPLPVNTAKILVKAHSPVHYKRLVTLTCSIHDEAGVEYATGEVTYYIFPETIAREKYRYPGKEAFLDL